MSKLDSNAGLRNRFNWKAHKRPLLGNMKDLNMFSNAYGNTSGAIDSFVFSSVCGALAGFIWFVIVQIKRHRKPKVEFQDGPSYKGFTLMPQASSLARGTANTDADWPLPMDIAS